MADITRPTQTLGHAGTQRTVSQIHAANQDFLGLSGRWAGEALQAGQPVYLHTDDKFYRCDANDAAKDECIGIVVKDAEAGRPVTVLYLGVMGGYTGLTRMALYYVSNTVGEIADAAGTAYMPVGIAVASDRILFFPMLSKILGVVHAAGIA